MRQGHAKLMLKILLKSFASHTGRYVFKLESLNFTLTFFMSRNPVLQVVKGLQNCLQFIIYFIFMQNAFFVCDLLDDKQWKWFSRKGHTHTSHLRGHELYAFLDFLGL